MKPITELCERIEDDDAWRALISRTAQRSAEPVELCVRGQFVNIKGEVEISLLRVTPPVPGRPRGELPREVCISAVPQPKGKA